MCSGYCIHIIINIPMARFLLTSVELEDIMKEDHTHETTEYLEIGKK